MIDAEKMKASWLEAVANGEAEGFARHWMPDILDALKLRQDVVEAAEKWAETQSVTDAVCPEVHNLWVAVGKLRSRVCESRGKHVGSQSCCPPRRASEGEPK